MTDDSSRFCVLKSAYVGGQPYKIENARVNGNDVFLRLSGIVDRNGAETLRGRFIEVDRAAAVALCDGEFFIADITGSTLFARTGDGETKIGRINAVQSFGAADVFSVECGDGKNMSFAFVKALDARYVVDKRAFSVDGDRLKEVAIYDED